MNGVSFLFIKRNIIQPVPDFCFCIKNKIRGSVISEIL